MCKQIEVLDGDGRPVAYISETGSRLLDCNGFALTPKRLGSIDCFLDFIGERRGLGSVITCYQAGDGGDVVRHVKLTTDDDGTFRQLFNALRSADWWDIENPALEHIRNQPLSK